MIRPLLRRACFKYTAVYNPCMPTDKVVPVSFVSNQMNYYIEVDGKHKSNAVVMHLKGKALKGRNRKHDLNLLIAKQVTISLG